MASLSQPAPLGASDRGIGGGADSEEARICSPQSESVPAALSASERAAYTVYVCVCARIGAVRQGDDLDEEGSIYLHALSSMGDGWALATRLPVWARRRLLPDAGKDSDGPPALHPGLAVLRRLVPHLLVD